MQSRAEQNRTKCNQRKNEKKTNVHMPLLRLPMPYEMCLQIACVAERAREAM